MTPRPTQLESPLGLNQLALKQLGQLLALIDTKSNNTELLDRFNRSNDAEIPRADMGSNILPIPPGPTWERL